MSYEIGSRGLKPIGAHANDARNKLEPGAILQLNGYDNPKYCIMKNLGTSERTADYGARYLVVNIKTLQQGQKSAYELKHISEKKDNRIQVYITDERLGADDILALWERSEAKRKDGRARWPEVFSVQHAYREVKESKAGDTHVIYAVKGQVVPAGETKNGGKVFTAWMRCNYKAMHNVVAAEKALSMAQANGDGAAILAAQKVVDDAKDDGQYKMSKGSTKKIGMIAVLAGADLSKTDLTGPLLQSLFPLKDVEENISPLDGKTYKVSFLDNSNSKFNKKNQQEIEAWAKVKDPATEGDPSD